MKKIFASLLTVCTLLLFAGCSDKIMGYSVVLWNIPEQQIQSGDVVPVYIKSNISHVYIVGKPDGTKSEIPLWQLTEPVKKSRIQLVSEKYNDNAHTYASVKLDGLPCRAEPVNTAKQVYRLRKGEIIKILYKGTGAAPMAGKKALEGDWYRILTDNGTMGWCFSYNLNLYETDVSGAKIGGETIVEEIEEDKYWNTVIGNIWYPDYFRTMIDSGDIDTRKINSSYRFAIDTENNKVYLNTPDIHESWEYTGYIKTDDREYSLKGISLKIIYKNSAYIVLRYTDSSGKPQDLNFVTISENISAIVSAEKERRSQEYLQIWSHGPVYSSTSYGRLSFEEDGVFHWSGYKLLVPSIIESGTKNSGSAGIKYSVNKTLANSYDGVITLMFEGAQSEVNFFYKLEGGALRLEDTNGAAKKGNQFTSRGTSPVILYFKVKK